MLQSSQKRPITTSLYLVHDINEIITSTMISQRAREMAVIY